MTKPTRLPLYILANNIRSLYNVGALFRLADGVGVEKLFLCGLTGAPHPRLKYQRQRQQIAKTALEGLNSVNWEYHQEIVPLIHKLQQEGVQVLALEQTSDSKRYYDIEYNKPTAIILGHEADGVSQDVLSMVNGSIEIPMHGAGKSLNVITAASVVAYHIRCAAIS